jgi:DNA-binding SARP family transcriptional activator
MSACLLTFTRGAALVRQGGGRIPLSRKDAALLCMLAAEGAWDRDALATTLWPSAGLLKARASLRQRRHRLSMAAGMRLTEGEDVLRLAGEVSHAWVDPAEHLKASMAALDGEVLEGCSFPECPLLEAWLARARARWRVLRCEAWERESGLLESAGLIGQALELAWRVAAQHPFSGHAQRLLMRLHHRRADLGAALEVYRSYAQRLDEEFGELPDNETALLAARLRIEEGLLPDSSGAGAAHGVPAWRARRVKPELPVRARPVLRTG